MWKVRASRKEAAHDIPQSMTGRREAAISIWVVEQQEMTKDQCIFPSLLCLSHPDLQRDDWATSPVIPRERDPLDRGGRV